MDPIIYRFNIEYDGSYRDIVDHALELGKQGYTECDEFCFDESDNYIYYILHNGAYTEDQLRILVEKYEVEDKVIG